MQIMDQENQERKNQEIGYALVLKKPSFIEKFKEFGGFFKWLDYKWRNLFGKPSKDGKRRLIEKDDKHIFTKGVTDFETKPEDFTLNNPGSTLVVSSITNTPSQTTVSIDNVPKSKSSFVEFDANNDKPTNNNIEAIAKKIDEKLNVLNMKSKPKKKNTAKKKPASKKKISTKKKPISKKKRK